jgi:DUF971 family protein
MLSSTNDSLSPLEIKRHAQDSIELRWSDGHISLYPNRYLRENCPCAGCREGHAPRRTLPVLGGKQIHALQITTVGRYAIRIDWSDQHANGIYSYETLRALCPCDACQPTGNAAP